MQILDTAIPDVKQLLPTRHGDHRGWLSETWRTTWLTATFVQENQSLSRDVGTLRGLHYQIPPRAQGKLVRVLRGAILDVAVDIRHGSRTFGHHVAIRVDAEQGNQVWIPPEFAHGFCVLEADTEVLYKLTDTWSPEHERGILWSDPDLGIDWPLPASGPRLSDRDLRHPGFADMPRHFEYAG